MLPRTGINYSMRRFEGKKVLVTGGAGFIGSHLTDRLVEEGAEVSILDNLYSGYVENINLSARFFEVDFCNLEAVKAVFEEGFDYVFHVGAWGRMPMCLEDPVGAYKNNVMGSLNILEAARQAGVKKVVLSSSCIVYCEETPYKGTKIAMEEIAKIYREAYKLPTACLRYGNVYGTRQKVGMDSAMFAMFKDTFNQNGYVNIFGDGKNTRDWVHVDDICEANMLAMLSDFQEEADIATGRSISLNEIVEVLDLPVKFCPPREGDAMHIKLNPDKAKSFGFETKIKFEDGIKQVWENL
jgi:UDP-glucose 4-epimerase